MVSANRERLFVHQDSAACIRICISDYWRVHYTYYIHIVPIHLGRVLLDSQRYIKISWKHFRLRKLRMKQRHDVEFESRICSDSAGNAKVVEELVMCFEAKLYHLRPKIGPCGRMATGWR